MSPWICKEMTRAHDCRWSGECKDLYKVEDEERGDSKVCPRVKFGLLLLISIRQMLYVVRLDLAIDLGLVGVMLVLVGKS
jgi:hypothetical protein